MSSTRDLIMEARIEGADAALKAWMPVVRALQENRREGTLGVIIPDIGTYEQATDIVHSKWNPPEED